MSDTETSGARRHFIVIGSMKSGTTTLYQHLLAHPDVAMSRMKETDFFIESMNWPLGQRWYDGQFDKGGRVTGEVSPNYTKYDIFPGVPERIAAYDPQTKLIFLARDPVDRLVSHYRHAVLLGHCDVKPDALLASRNGDHMLETSRYAKQLEKYLAVFPRDQLLILDFAELARAPQDSLDRVTEFLDLPRHTISSVATQNDAGSIAAMPRWIQRLWRSRAMRRFDRLISREMRDRARAMLSRGKATPPPAFPDSLRQDVAALLKDDAQAFRKLSGLDFPDWAV